MADDPVKTSNRTLPGDTDSHAPMTPEEQASYDALLAALGKIDLRQALADAGLSIETAPDGSLVMKDKGTTPPGDIEAYLATGVLPPDVPADSLATNPHHGENDMGLFDKFRICICSEVTGVITKDGKPVAGAEIIRRLDLYLPKDRVYTDQTITDSAGRFTFKPAYAKKSKHLAFVAVANDQKILVRHEGKLYLGWGNISRGCELHEDVQAFNGVAAPGYHPLDFDGDLSRATPLPEDVDLNQLMQDEGFFNSQVVEVASHLHFFVTMNGEPAVGAKVVRTAEHVGHHTYEQTKTSDIDGEVEIAPIIAARFAHAWEQFEIKQKIVITYQGKDYLAWEKTKTNPWENGEYNLDNKKIVFSAEISAELTDDPNAIRGVVTDLARCWKGKEGEDYLPPDAIQYKGLFQVTRYDR